MTGVAFEQKWEQLVLPHGNVADPKPFLYLPEIIMPKMYWNESLVDDLIRGVDCWQAVIRDPIYDFDGLTIDITDEGLQATEVLYNRVLGIGSTAIGIDRDEAQEKVIYDQAVDAFFPDDYFIGQEQVPELYRELVVRPAGLRIKLQEALGKSSLDKRVEVVN